MRRVPRLLRVARGLLRLLLDRQAAAGVPARGKIKVRLDIDQVSGATPNLAIDDVILEIDPGDLRYLTFAVWQVSAQVGRGFASEATVEIVP